MYGLVSKRSKGVWVVPIQETFQLEVRLRERVR